ncbi:MAG TPA: O-methyltransferase [Acidimicrobiales bacterium]|nr:O-methyltransferase [Acidimicrobiales bacterium]
MNDERWQDVDDFVEMTFALRDEELESVLVASARAGLPAINVAANQGKLLELLASAIGARRILEIGTLGGYSTLWLARALPEEGELVTLEFDPTHAAVARANFAASRRNSAIRVIEGAAGDSLAHLIDADEAPFDFIFIDADKEGYAEYFALSMQLAHSGTMIVADNVVRAGAVADSSNDDPRVQGVRRFLEAVAADERVSATVVQTVGTKGYDGLAFILVR